MKTLHQFLLGSLVILSSCSRHAPIPVFIENTSEATLSNVVVVGLAHTNWIPPISPQMEHEVGTVLPNAAGGFSVRLDCEAGGKNLSHDTAHSLKTNILARSVFFTVEPNLEVRCGFANARGVRVTPTEK